MIQKDVERCNPARATFTYLRRPTPAPTPRVAVPDEKAVIIMSLSHQERWRMGENRRDGAGRMGAERGWRA